MIQNKHLSGIAVALGLALTLPQAAFAQTGEYLQTDTSLTTSHTSWILWLIPLLALGVIAGIAGYIAYSWWQERHAHHYRLADDIALTGSKGGEVTRRTTENDIYVTYLNHHTYHRHNEWFNEL